VGCDYQTVASLYIGPWSNGRAHAGHDREMSHGEKRRCWNPVNPQVRGRLRVIAMSRASEQFSDLCGAKTRIYSWCSKGVPFYPRMQKPSNRSS
jgi:hypothetical protein